MRYLAAALLALLIGGCAKDPIWDKPGAGMDGWNRDTYECQKDAYAIGGGATYVAFGQVVRGNSTPNMNIYNSCMTAKGWILRK